MTAYIYDFRPGSVVVAMDSLVSSQDRSPLRYGTKLFPMPHLRGVIFGTGSFDVILDWVDFVQRSAIVDSILPLNERAPVVLPVAMARYGHAKDRSTTIFHFGYVEPEKRFVGFVFKSENGFALEELKYGATAFPGDDSLREDLLSAIRETGPPGLVGLMERQRTSENQKSPGERVPIGGEIHLLVVEAERQYLWVCHRFRDYSDVAEKMREQVR